MIVKTTSGQRLVVYANSRKHPTCSQRPFVPVPIEIIVADNGTGIFHLFITFQLKDGSQFSYKYLAGSVTDLLNLRSALLTTASSCSDLQHGGELFNFFVRQTCTDKVPV
jgi:hypothetical protein